MTAGLELYVDVLFHKNCGIESLNGCLVQFILTFYIQDRVVMGFRVGFWSAHPFIFQDVDVTAGLEPYVDVYSERTAGLGPSTFV